MAGDKYTVTPHSSSNSQTGARLVRTFERFRQKDSGDEGSGDYRKSRCFDQENKERHGVLL
jgi:hypothetical protein